MWYPRTEQINKKRVLPPGIEALVLAMFELYWMNQHLIPIIKSSADVYLTGTLAQISEKFVDAINVYLFYVATTSYYLFHVLPNLMSELLQFAHRDFYDDWWNSTSVRGFWNHWNLPVHVWLKRHIYYPLLKRGYSKSMASCGAFLFSGIMHEYITHVSVGFVSYYCFVVFSIQAVFMFLETKYKLNFKRLNIGNIYMWVGFMGSTLTIGMMMCRIQYLALNKGETNAVL